MRGEGLEKGLGDGRRDDEREGARRVEGLGDGDRRGEKGLGEDARK